MATIRLNNAVKPSFTIKFIKSWSNRPIGVYDFDVGGLVSCFGLSGDGKYWMTHYGFIEKEYAERLV